VAKTGRLVIVRKAARNVGVGAEIAAVAEHGLYDLEAPIQRVSYDTIVPLARWNMITYPVWRALSMRCADALNNKFAGRGALPQD
jgi:pyruvate/2-oxoglutarate/acetoin dehydrogenase E1 component